MCFFAVPFPWSFRLEEIGLGARCSIWYGTDDFEPIKLGAPWMAALVRGARLVEVDGHHGFKSEPRHLAAILSTLRDAALLAPP